jgi:hypothetical protein
MTTAIATRTVNFIDDDTLRTNYPTIFAERPHLSRSDRYEYIPTATVLSALKREGFQPTQVSVARVRSPKQVSGNGEAVAAELESRHGYEKHLIRLRRTDAQPVREVGDVFPEIVLMNSHDGTSTYQLMAGIFRLVCSNGMIVKDNDFGSIRIPHKGRIVDNVLEASFKVLQQSTIGIEAAQRWSQLTLTDQQTNALAVGAHHIRFADSNDEVNTPIKPEQLLRVRRPIDNGNTLWQVFNRIQENALRGGLTAQQSNVSGNGRARWITTREVKGIDGNVNFNSALWELGLTMETIAKRN